MSTNADDSIAPAIDQIRDGWIGLTKREYFAAIALQGILSNTETLSSDDNMCIECCNIADSLIKQLNDTSKG